MDPELVTVAFTFVAGAAVVFFVALFAVRKQKGGESGESSPEPSPVHRPQPERTKSELLWYGPRAGTVAFTFVAGAAVVFFVALFAVRKQKGGESGESSPEPSPVHRPQPERTKKAEKPGRRVQASKEPTFHHPWLASSLKGHSGRVLDLDFSSNGKHLISSAEDRTLLLWNTKDFSEREHKSVRGNVELDHGRLVRFAPDCKSLVLALAFANKVAIYKDTNFEDNSTLSKKEEGSGVRITPVDSVEYPKAHVQDICNLGVACSGRFIMTASAEAHITIWDLRGSVIKTLETKQSTLHQASVSPCGRFVASSGFTPDVLVWELKFTRTGDFQEMKRAFELKGHSSGVLAFDFNQDSTRMVSASKDGTWRLWDTDVRYEHGQDPRLVKTGRLDELRTTPAASIRVAMAPNGSSFALSLGNNLRVYRWSTDGLEEPDGEMDEVHTESITAIRFSPDSHFLVSAGDRHVRVFHNVSERLGTLDTVSGLLKTASGEAHRERLREQQRQAQEFLETLDL